MRRLRFNHLHRVLCGQKAFNTENTEDLLSWLLLCRALLLIANFFVTRVESTATNVRNPEFEIRNQRWLQPLARAAY
jgi:hypothetical protein